MPKLKSKRNLSERFSGHLTQTEAGMVSVVSLLLASPVSLTVTAGAQARAGVTGFRVDLSGDPRLVINLLISHCALGIGLPRNFFLPWYVNFTSYNFQLPGIISIIASTMIRTQQATSSTPFCDHSLSLRPMCGLILS